MTRQILLSPSLALRSPVFGALRTYLGAVAKVIEARDALREAYAYVAGEVIEVRRRDKGTKDPLERIARLVGELRDNPARRVASSECVFPVAAAAELRCADVRKHT